MSNNEDNLIGKYITVVYRITDPAEWRKTNPLHYKHNGLEAVGVSVGDLQEKCERLDRWLDKVISELSGGVE